MTSYLLLGMIHFIGAYVNGICAQRNYLKVNYTRKINHFLFLLAPFFVQFLTGLSPATQTVPLWSLYAMYSAALLIFVPPLRKRITLLETLFASFDRPEDRPYTLVWTGLQAALSSVVIFVFDIVYTQSGHDPRLMLLPLLVCAIGDGLAEPVGVYLGNYRYQVQALFCNRVYERTLEGSACVFLTAIGALWFHQPLFTDMEWYLGLLLFPPVITLTEAVSPHSFDMPFMLGVGFVLLIVVV